jgi:hypothetical protein
MSLQKTLSPARQDLYSRMRNHFASSRHYERTAVFFVYPRQQKVPVFLFFALIAVSAEAVFTNFKTAAPSDAGEESERDQYAA